MKNLAKFFLELGMLKNVKRSGWWMAGIKHPEDVADHTFRAAAIGYVLARLEKADADKVVKMCLFHELAETRISDTHKVGRRYIKPEIEMTIIKEQTKLLPDSIGNELLDLMTELESNKTKEAIIANDADYLECAIQAKEYRDTGHKLTEEWIETVRKMLKTKTAKEILKAVEKSEPWWTGLKQLD